MTVPAQHPAIPEARVDDLDLDDENDRAEWERRLAALAQARLGQARARLERMGVIDEDGRLVSSAVPADMLPASDTSVETG
ncbi:MAG: hypothetical protein IT377_05455 [Polyangiaceae bacterium]|nr:hypothetical protein [Polyangiaceae bacterium]